MASSKKSMKSSKNLKNSGLSRGSEKNLMSSGRISKKSSGMKVNASSRMKGRLSMAVSSSASQMKKIGRNLSLSGQRSRARSGLAKQKAGGAKGMLKSRAFSFQKNSAFGSSSIKSRRFSSNLGRSKGVKKASAARGSKAGQLKAVADSKAKARHGRTMEKTGAKRAPSTLAKSRSAKGAKKEQEFKSHSVTAAKAKARNTTSVGKSAAKRDLNTAARSKSTKSAKKGQSSKLGSSSKKNC